MKKIFLPAKEFVDFALWKRDFKMNIVLISDANKAPANIYLPSDV